MVAATRVLAATCALAVLAAGAYILYTVDPSTSGLYPRCLFKTATGYDCPGCGSTRAVHHLLHGRIGTAFRYNPMLFVAGVAFAPALVTLVRGRTPEYVARPWFAWSALVVTVGWWIARNVA